MEFEKLVFIDRLSHFNGMICIGLFIGNKVFVHPPGHLLKFHPSGSKSFNVMFCFCSE